MVQVILGKKRFLVRFQDGREKNLSSNQLTIVIVEKITDETDAKIFTNPEIPEEQLRMEKGYYQCVYVMLCFKNEVGVGSIEEQAGLGDDPGEDYMEDVKLDNERERHWRMVFEENDGGVDNNRALLHAKRWDVYVNENEKIIKGGY